MCYLCLDLQDLLLKYFKECCVYLSAKGLGQRDDNRKALDCLIDRVREDTLHIDDCGVYLVAGGPLKPVFKDLMFKGSKIVDCANNCTPCNYRCLNLAQNILQAKRGTPPAEPWMVEQAVENHRKALTEPHAGPSDPLCLEWQDHQRRLVCEVLDILVQHLFGGVVAELENKVPSLNSCFERSIKQGGAITEIFSRMVPRLMKDDEFSKPQTFLGFSELDAMIEHPVSGSVLELRNPASIRLLAEKYDKLLCQLDLEDWAVHSEIYTLPVGIVEPAGKVRIATSGEAVRYARMLSLQKFLFGVMGKTQLFHLIGSPIDDDWWERTYPADLCASLRESHYFVSGDYSAATDGLDPSLCEYAWDALGRNVLLRKKDGSLVRLLDTSWYTLGGTGLTGHRLFNGMKRHEATENPASGFPQRWGQLMGSPISFPILNLINMAGTITSLLGSRNPTPLLVLSLI